MPNELRPVPGFESHISVTQDGRVWSHSKNRWRVPALDGPNGYLIFYVAVGNGNSVKRRVHRCVAEAWIPNPENLPFVNHKDGCKTNNHASNLEWCTASDNLRHSWQTGLRRTTERTRAVSLLGGRANRKFSDSEAARIRSLFRGGRSIRSLSFEFSCSRTVIQKIASGKHYADVAEVAE